MKLSLVSYAVLALAVPALGDNAYLTQPVLAELTAIDTPPTAAALNSEFATPAMAQTGLSAIATDPGVDLGVRIRAIRTLAGYCPGSCATVHDTLVQLIAAHQAAPTGQELLVLRAAVESIGAANAVLAADVPALLALLVHPSRDVRATVARTLRTTCSRQVLTAVIAAQADEPTAQVRHELASTEDTLSACVPP